MKERINVAELLKDCPKGMELDCTMFEDVKFISVEEDDKPICIRTGDIYRYLTKFGTWTFDDNAKCVIFPKGKTTWKGFVPPCKYKAGDVLVSKAGNIVLFSHIDSNNAVNYHCIIPTYDNFRIEENTGIGVGKYYDCVLADEQQRQRMYDRIKSAGYKYNQNINKLEKLIIPNFKKGDKVRVKKGVSEHRIIDDVCDTFYTLVPIGRIDFTDQDNWELAPNKFDITTLKPYQKVLFRQSEDCIWLNSFFGFYDKNNKTHPFICCNGFAFKYCIPYEKNKHLLGTTDDCDEYYKTWE